MTWMLHWFFLLRAFTWLVLAFARASWYFRHKALHELQLPHPEMLSSGEKRRLKHYFYGTTYLSILFCCLRGRPRTVREKHIFTNLAALAYFFDDLADLYNRNRAVFTKMDLSTFGAVADERGLAMHLLNNIYRELPEDQLEQFKTYLNRVFDVETEGRQLKGSHSNTNSTHHLKEITAEKGGYSVLLFRRVLSNQLSAKEEEAWYAFGYLIQLCDDIFDIWFDERDGIHTLATESARSGQITALQALFEAQVSKTKSLLMQTTYPFAQRRTALAAMYIIVCITRVCLNHYHSLLKKHGHLPMDNRQSIVVDMEKWKYRIQVGISLAFKRV